MEISSLIQAAMEAMSHSYSPYSHFQVGAAIYSPSKGIITGCNVENVAYPASTCAERTAICKAVSEGAMDFTAICIVGGKYGKISDFVTPCGLCRQTLAEFSLGKNMQIIVAKSVEEYQVYSMDDLLKDAFLPSQLQ